MQTRVATRLTPVLLALATCAYAQQASIRNMGIVGYADRLSVQQGETIKFMVSSQLPRFRADIVRLIHGDPNPKGPGIREEVIALAANGEYPGKPQELPLGSYVTVPDNQALRLSGSFTIAAWIAPTAPFNPGTTSFSAVLPSPRRALGIVTKWSPDGTGYGLMLGEDGAIELWLGEKGSLTKVSTKVPVRRWSPSIYGGNPDRPRPQMVNTPPHNWYLVAATFDAASGRAAVHQLPLGQLPVDDTRVVVDQTLPVKRVAATDVPLLISGYWVVRDGTAKPRVGGHFNGKIDSPRIYDRALSRQEIEAMQRGQPPDGATAAWDFSREMSGRRIVDTSSRKLDGEAVNFPTRAMTGHNWDLKEMNFNHARHMWGAIYFHDDDLEDATWDVSFELPVPANLKSGVYAARLRAGNDEDYVPFFVRPRKGTATARIAYLVPTFSYLAYGGTGPELLSLYSRHSDGSGVAYSSSLRPILNMRPKITTRNPWQFMADTHLTDWMEAKKFPFDVITDHDVHHEGAALLKPYKVVVTGTHPEYQSTEILDALAGYLNGGGRLMYMGGNGFYWITPLAPEGHYIEVRRRDGTEAWQGAPGEGYHSTTGESGGLWRFRGRPPQALVGVGFTAQGFDYNVPFRRMPGSFDPRVAFIFDGIGPDELIGNHPSLVLERGAAGSELDRVDYALGSPPHTLILATSSGHSENYHHVVEEVNTSDSRQHGTVNPLVKADMAYLEYPNGGAVWTSSSIAWCGSLSYNQYNNNVSRITENVLRRFSSDEPLSPAPRPTASKR